MKICACVGGEAPRLQCCSSHLYLLHSTPSTTELTLTRIWELCTARFLLLVPRVVYWSTEYPAPDDACTSDVRPAQRDSK